MGGKSAGSKGRKGRMPTQDPSSSQLPNASQDPPMPAPPQTSPELCRHDTGDIPWPDTGSWPPCTAWLGCHGGQEGGPRAHSAPVPIQLVICFSQVASAPARRGIAFPDVGRIEQVGLVWACEILHGVGPILNRFCHMALLPFSSTAEPAMPGVSPSMKGWLP